MPKITELDSVISLDGNDVLPIVSKNNNNEDETMKVAINLIGNKLLNSNEYGALNTTDKKIIGAINEVNTKASQFDNMTATATGSIATFSNGGDDIPVSEYECEIVAQQASGTPTPTSPLPITGFSQADITVTDNDQISNVYVVSFGQTIYGGRLIYKNGEWSIEATKAFVEITGSEGIYLDTAPNVVALSGIPIPISQVDTSLLEPMSNIATYSTQGTGNFNNNEFGLRTTGIVYYKNTSCTTLSDFQTFFTNTHLQICYKLATPVIIPLTSSTRVKTISGDNNIYSNTGDCEVKYFTNKADSLAELIKAFVL